MIDPPTRISAQNVGHGDEIAVVHRSDERPPAKLPAQPPSRTSSLPAFRINLSTFTKIKQLHADSYDERDTAARRRRVIPLWCWFCRNASGTK
jgi:hypothetical protein